jgi:hypothetical protein
MTLVMGTTYRRAIAQAFAASSIAITDALKLDRENVFLSEFELSRALDETDRFVKNLQEQRSTELVSKGKFAGALLYFLRQCRPIQLLSEQDAVNKNVDVTRFQDLICLMFVCEYILHHQPPRGILLELTFLLRQNDISAPALGLLFEAFLVFANKTGPHFMDEAVV